MFAMVDCNNFYVSCERVFRPDWQNKPMIVLSNNDGCVVSRSQEAKDLGIGMAVPYFKIKQIVRDNDVIVCSSNYALYADMSNRVMSCLEQMAVEIEVYSVDEAFLRLDGVDHLHDFLEYGYEIKKRIQDWVGLPVSVGIAPTKTLAKLAGYGAKKNAHHNGVMVFSNKDEQDTLMSTVMVGDVWGVGHRMIERLNAQGILTALDLANAPSKRLREQTSVLLERTITELNGVSCFDFDSLPSSKKAIINSRSFGSPVTSLDELTVAVSNHASKASEKLREQDCYTCSISIFLKTNRFANDDKQHKASATYNFLQATNHSLEITSACSHLVKQLFREGYRYKKVGVILHGLEEHDNRQMSLFPSRDAQQDERLMEVMDSINQRYRKGVFVGSTLSAKGEIAWKMNRKSLSPAYTTNWNELPNVY